MNKRGARRVRQVKANRRLKNFGKINWKVYEHRQMWDMVMSAEVPLMATRTAQWQVLASAVDSATNEVQHIVRQLAESWRGPSAGAAAESVNRLTSWATDASERAYRVGNGLDTYTSALVEARARMPEPVHPTAERWFREGRDVSVLDGPQGAYMVDQLLDDHLPSKRQQQDAHAEAVRVMTGFEDASRGVHDRLPEFEGAPATTTITPDHRPLPVGPTLLPPPLPVPPPWVRPPSVPGPPAGEDPAVTPFPPGTRPADTTSVASAGGLPGPGGFGPGTGLAPGYHGPGGTAGYGGHAGGPGSGGFGRRGQGAG
ncbi:PPE domain-containing protein, partial [Saccharothrix sp. Mg75]|uniref:PPE domain-containing protein n=1 Tax=Saccharothrix sp. Mg75 TaxID=3445357 RepID=UPI003EEE678A